MKQLIDTLEKENELAALVEKAYVKNEDPQVAKILSKAMQMLGF
jgi:hypothetical protein